MPTKPQVIAFYLPQFHPIPENDAWWGKGFTEWTNVGKAKPLFWGHYQPRVPADLGYYDLRVPETREAQAELAKEAGISAFCYWHYWFGNGKRLLERPFSEVLQSGKPDFPFCLAWANESWKNFDGDLGNRKILIEQLYPGIEDYTHHFYTVLPAFRDKRYVRVNDKPLFMIYKPIDNSEISSFIDVWRNLATKNGLPGIFFVGHCFNDKEKIFDYRKLGLDAINTLGMDSYAKQRNIIIKNINRIYRALFRKPFIVSYRKASKYFFDQTIDGQDDIIPTIITGWDHTPRSGWRGSVMINTTPTFFSGHASNVIENCNKKLNIIFLKSWNEWAEGNYIEPDLKWGNAYIEALSSILAK
jgi:hypothetical protein